MTYKTLHNIRMMIREAIGSVNGLDDSHDISSDELVDDLISDDEFDDITQEVSDLSVWCRKFGKKYKTYASQAGGTGYAVGYEYNVRGDAFLDVARQLDDQYTFDSIEALVRWLRSQAKLRGKHHGAVIINAVWNHVADKVEHDRREF